MQATAPAMLQSTLADIATWPSFQPREAKNYTDCFATLTACSILDGNAARARASLLDDDATEHVYQLNNVYVPQPSCSHEIRLRGSLTQALLLPSCSLDDRLFARFDCWDSANK